MLLTNCADAMRANSAERNGAHGEDRIADFAPAGDPASSVCAVINPYLLDFQQAFRGAQIAFAESAQIFGFELPARHRVILGVKRATTN